MIIHKRAMYCPYCQSHKVRREHRNTVQKYVLNTKSMFKCGSCEKKFARKAAFYREDLVSEKVVTETA